jgi:hypothetical protein
MKHPADPLVEKTEKTQKTQTCERSKEMSHLMHEEMARAHLDARLERARKARREYELTRAWRLSRKAERAAAQARLALARAL